MAFRKMYCSVMTFDMNLGFESFVNSEECKTKVRVRNFG